jgi:succinate dehydrogenase / fumarate reductase, flavoprotein subunit
MLREITNPSEEKIIALGKKWIEEKYGNLFQMYQKITDDNPYETPMKIYPAVHYTMGGVWVDYNLQSSIPGCFVAGEANFSDHGANRLGASALMQGLADGYFVLPYTVSDYLANEIRTGKISTDSPEFVEAEEQVRELINRFINNNGTKSVDHFHKRLGLIMWNKVGMARNEKGLNEAISEIAQLRDEFYKEVYIPGTADELNPELEKALRVADFLELGQLMAMDSLQRLESCGGHFREEYQDEEGETLRDDENFKFVSAWEYKGSDISQSILHKEELKYEFIKIAARNYK